MNKTQRSGIRIENHTANATKRYVDHVPKTS